MCRSLSEGGRRCRWHSAPTAIAITNAQRRVTYHEDRCDAVAGTAAEDRALGNYTQALEDLAIAEEVHAFRVLDPDPSRHAEFERDKVAGQSTEWLLQQHQQCADDPDAQEVIAERLVEREEEGEALPPQATFAVKRAMTTLSRRLANDGLYSDEDEARTAVAGWFGQKPDEDVSEAQAAGMSEAQARRDYEDMLAFEMLRASEETRGTLLSKRGVAKGISAEALFRGPLRQVETYASDELRSYWARRGRTTWAAFRHQALGRASDRGAAERSRTQLPDDVALV